MRILNVAEKNDAAKRLAAIMSGGQSRKREGISKFNKIYEFNCHILNTNAHMVMTSVSGHLMGLEFSQGYRKWQSCAPLQLFTAPVVKYVGEDYQKIKRTLEREVRGSQALIIWTDCDREGENIGFEIIGVCTKVCPQIKVYRAKFSEITPQSVSRACASLVPPDKLQAEAVDVRIELDLRIGAAFTRFQTLRLKKVFPNVLSDQLISYGSCQFPTLGFVVDRYKQVEQFVPEQFFKIKVTHETESDKTDFTWKRGRLYHHTPCLILYQMCLENPTAVVTGTSSRPKNKWRPVALDTVELEKLASRKLRINAKETMKIAEKLYNQGFISYPRTETNIFPSSLNLAELIQKQTQDQEWGGFASGVLTHGPNPRQGRKTDNAHPPIHPTNYTNNLQGNEKRVYEFIVRHFLACCSKDAVGRETSVEIDIAGEKFTATGLMVLERNYLEVYPYDRWSDKTIPVYNEGQQFQPTSIEMVEGETSAPPLLTEADLIALMEKHGIGTDATHADHIETIKSRSYVGLQGDGTFLPGQLGMGLVEGYDLMQFDFSKPKLRAAFEADLKRICEGTKCGADVLREQIAKYREKFVEAAQQAMKLDQALSAYFGNPETFSEAELNVQVNNPRVRPCPRCKQEHMTLRKTKDGNYMIGCLGYPQCRACVFLPKFVVNAEVDESVCRVCGPGEVHRLKFTFKRGSVPPMIPLQYTSCIGGCDEMLRETLDIRDISSSSLQTGEIRNSRPSQQTRTRDGLGRGRGQRNNKKTAQRQTNTAPSTQSAQRQTNTAPNTQSAQRQTNTAPNSFVLSNQTFIGSDTRGRGSNAFHSTSQSGNGRSNTWNQSSFTDSGFSSGNTFNSFTSNPSEENSVVCACGTTATMFTVKKDGPNKGRQFYRCPKREGGCDFFLWADCGVPQQPSTTTIPFLANNTTSTGWSSAGNVQGSSFSQGLDNLNDTVCTCNCNEPAVSRTVKKDGPNQGRQFYACPKPMGQGCSFFQWSDQEVPPPQSRGFGASRGRGMGLGSRGRGGKKRKCGNCHVEGHTKKTCPDKR